MLRILRISGLSLEPEYREGDFVVCSKIPFMFREPQPGDVVVFIHGLYGLLIKRVERIEPDGGIFVVGSHAHSIDSRTFGPVARSALLGRVVTHVRRTHRD